jgi:hypothetical protein
MLSFAQFITEEKNLHLVHAEDAIIDGGVIGTRRVINYLRAIRDMFAGNAAKKINMTTKFDGSPSVFAGYDPVDGRFFVAKKGIFNKNPKIYKTPDEVDADTSGDLNAKLKLALAEFPKLGMNKGVVLQGDFLYSADDLKTTTVGDESYVTFHPNTIMYAIPAQSSLAKTIRRSKVGVVWHTVYRGKSLETMSASFGEKIAGTLKTVNSVWSVDAYFDDVSGKATFTKDETSRITKMLSDAGKIFQKLPANVLNDLADNETRRIRVNAFINSKIRQGERIANPTTFVAEMIVSLNGFFDKDIDSKKSAAGKEAAREKKANVMSYFEQTKKSDLIAMFTLYNHIVDAKHMVIDKLNEVGQMRTFLRTKNGYEVTGQEGFVVSDHLGKNALKLVDRLSFSKANFSPEYIKGFEKRA